MSVADDQMARDHRNDSEDERLMRDAVRALDALLTKQHGRLYPRLLGATTVLRDDLRRQADHIVQVWD